MTGFLLIDKPAGPTSHDVVDAIRRLTDEKRVGHAGTLDPFATGLLIVGVGREATREFSKLSGLDKSYEAAFVLGATSDTDDRTGKIEVTRDRGPGTGAEIEKAIKKFIGEIDQVPPAYAAIKVGGKKMYEAARRGKPITAKPRRVRIYEFELVELMKDDGAAGTGGVSFRSLSANADRRKEMPRMPAAIRVSISCSSGTYVRALARDLGEALVCGAYVDALRRTRIGPFSITEATPLSNLKPETIATHLLPIKTVLSRPLSGGPTSAKLEL